METLYCYTALHYQVLVAFTTCDDTNTWQAYIFPVPGENHALEANLWYDNGNPITATQAEALWPWAVSELKDNGFVPA